MEKIILPIATSIIVDDVGWHDGADKRYMNEPARKGSTPITQRFAPRTASAQ